MKRKIFPHVREGGRSLIKKFSLKGALSKQGFKGSTRGMMEYKKIEPDCREGVRAQLERMKELCKERNSLYEKQNDLKGQKWKIEKPLKR